MTERPSSDRDTLPVPLIAPLGVNPPRSAGRSLSRAKELLKGLFLPLLISLVCLAPHPFVDEYQRSHNYDYSRFSVVDVDKVLVPLLSIGLAAFWWRPARWRSYGVLIGLVLLPALLLALFLAAVAIFDIQVAPK